MINISVSRRIFVPRFLPLLEDSHRVMLLLGGGASGKSYFAFQRCVYLALKNAGSKTLIVRKSATDLRRSCWADVMRTLGQFRIKELCRVNSTLLEVEMPNKSTLLFMGLDNFEKVKSIPDINSIYVEEASEITFDDYSQLLQRTRGRGGGTNQIVLMSNPVSKANWLYRHFFENGCSEPDCIIDRSTYRDNPFCSEETAKALEQYKETNPYFYCVYCLGEWGSVSRRVFENYKVDELDMGALRKKGLRHLVGMDFGFVNDPTAIVEALADPEHKIIYVIREVCQTGLLNSDIAQRLKAMGLAKSTIIADSAEQKSIEEIRRAGIPHIKASAKGAGSVNQGIQLLKQYDLIVDASCLDLIEELENYSYKRDRATGEYTNEPIDRYNHCIDALRYSLQCLDLKPKLKTAKAYLF